MLQEWIFQSAEAEVSSQQKTALFSKNNISFTAQAAVFEPFAPFEWMQLLLRDAECIL